MTLVESPGLVRALAEDARPPDPHVEALLAKTLAAVAEEQGPAAKMRELSTVVRIALALGVAVVVPLLVLFVTPRPDLDVVPRGRFALDVFLYSLSATAALVVALWPMQRTVSMHTRALVALCAVLASACVAALPPIHGLHAGSLVGTEDFGRRAMACLMFGTLAAVPTFVVMRMLAREGARVGGKAFVLGLAAALSGSAAVFLHCPITHPGHLWAGHVTVLLPAAIWALVHGRGRL
jgi:hypothetical protein